MSLFARVMTQGEANALMLAALATIVGFLLIILPLFLFAWVVDKLAEHFK